MTTPAPQGTEGGGRDQRTAATTTTADRTDATWTSSPSVPAQLRRRRAAAWRCEPLADGGRDPWSDQPSRYWTASEVDAWQFAAEHLRGHQLYGSWQVPESVRVSWRRRQGCSRGGDPSCPSR